MNVVNTLPTLTDKQIQRFWSKVDVRAESECWVWKGCLLNDGYGAVGFGSKQFRTHRAAFFIANGDLPAGKLVCHSCDTPQCCNPAHLWLGTTAENVADRVAKGRTVCGDQHYSRTEPERLARGDRNGSRVHPERLPRGDRNGSILHPDRRPKGESHGCSILNSLQVTSIRDEYAAGNISTTALAKKYGISQGNVMSILQRKTWAHVA